MGCYKIETIQKDFDIASKGYPFPVFNLLIIAATAILETMPDNEARDMAISNLLSAAEMVTASFLLNYRQ